MSIKNYIGHLNKFQIYVKCCTPLDFSGKEFWQLIYYNSLPHQWGLGLLNCNIITSILLTITKISLKASHVHILFRRLSTHPNLINTEIKKLTHPFLLDDSKTCHACGGEGWCGDVDGRGVDWLVKIFFILIKK